MLLLLPPLVLLVLVLLLLAPLLLRLVLLLLELPTGAGLVAGASEGEAAGPAGVAPPAPPLSSVAGPLLPTVASPPLNFLPALSPPSAAVVAAQLLLAARGAAAAALWVVGVVVVVVPALPARGSLVEGGPMNWCVPAGTTPPPSCAEDPGGLTAPTLPQLAMDFCKICDTLSYAVRGEDGGGGERGRPGLPFLLNTRDTMVLLCGRCTSQASGRMRRRRPTLPVA